DIVTTSFVGIPDVVAPSVSLTAPADGATANGLVTVTATAADNVGVAGVQFKLDGLDLGVEVATPPYSILWNSATSPNDRHILSAVARDDAGNAATAAGVSVLVANAVSPIISWPPPQRIIVGTPLSSTQLNATANTDGTFTYSPPAGTKLPAGAGQTLSTAF